MLHWTLVLGSSAPPAVASTDVCHSQQLALPEGVPPPLAGQDPAHRGHVPISHAAHVGMYPWPAQHPCQAAAHQPHSAQSNPPALPLTAGTLAAQSDLPQHARQTHAYPAGVPPAQAAHLGMSPWPAQHPDQAAAPQYQPAVSIQLAVPAQASLARPENSQPAIHASLATDTQPLLSAPQSQSATFVPLALPPSTSTVAVAPYILPEVQPQSSSAGRQPQLSSVLFQSSNAHLPPTLPAPGQHSQGFPAPFPTSALAARISYTDASQIQRGPVSAPPSSAPLQAAGHMQRTPALAAPSTSMGSGPIQAVGLMQRTHMIAAPSIVSGPRLQAAGHIQSMSVSASPAASSGTAALQQQQQSSLPVTTSGSAALSGSRPLAAPNTSLNRDSAQQQQQSRFLAPKPGSGGLCTFTAQHSSAFAPYQRPSLPGSSMGGAVQPSSGCASIRQDSSPLFMPKPATQTASPRELPVHSSPTTESVPG